MSFLKIFSRVAGWPKKRELGPLSSGQGKSMQFVDPDRIEQSDHVQAASFAPTTLSLYSLVQVISKPTHRFGHVIDWVIVRFDDDIHIKSTVTDSLESDHYCTKSYFNVSVSKPSTLYRTVRNMANIDHPSFIAELSSVSDFSSVEKANHYCDFLRTVLDTHALPSLQKVINQNSFPWFESIRDEHFIAKRERLNAERKWRISRICTDRQSTRFQNLCTQLNVI